MDRFHVCLRTRIENLSQCIACSGIRISGRNERRYLRTRKVLSVKICCGGNTIESKIMWSMSSDPQQIIVTCADASTHNVGGYCATTETYFSEKVPEDLLDESIALKELHASICAMNLAGKQSNTHYVNITDNSNAMYCFNKLKSKNKLADRMINNLVDQDPSNTYSSLYVSTLWNTISDCLSREKAETAVLLGKLFNQDLCTHVCHYCL